MGHFTIILPNNQQGDVRCGTIRKKTLFLGLFGINKQPNEVKKGYIVTVEPATENRKEYRYGKRIRSLTWLRIDYQSRCTQR